MKNMKIPTRPAPSVEEAIRKNPSIRPTNQHVKKKPPPRPPPPNFTKSKSAWNLNQPFEETSLIDLSPPNSPKSFVASRNRAFGGSISSSFSSSTSSLASSKKSFEYEVVNLDPWSLPLSGNPPQSTFYINPTQQTDRPNVPQLSAPTIIRAQPNKHNVQKNKSPLVLKREVSPQMPSIPPPSPPKDVAVITTPYGLALYDFQGSQTDDLSMKENDVVFLLHRVNSEWLYGRIDDREGMFPANFVDIQVPLPENDRLVTALYAFTPQMSGDLPLFPGQQIEVIARVSTEWLMGEANGQRGQFPANFVDRVPTSL